MPELASRSPGELAHRAASPPRGAGIASVAMSVPDRTVSNGPIAARLGVDEGWIERRTGVRERRIADTGERLANVASRAGAMALQRARVEPSDLDLVLVATMSPDEIAPNAAPLVAAQLGTASAGAIDVGAACTGFLSALALGVAQIEARRAERVLVIGADLMSRLTDPDDRSTAGLLADGAGAALLEATEATGRIGPVVLGSDGARAALVTASHRDRRLRMNGHDTFKHAVARLCEATVEALARADAFLDQVDLFVYHQANSRIIRAVGEQLDLPADRVADYVPRFGNTSAATLPMALALAQEEGRLEDGATVLLGAFGAGLTWGATVVEWGVRDA